MTTWHVAGRASLGESVVCGSDIDHSKHSIDGKLLLVDLACRVFQFIKIDLFCTPKCDDVAACGQICLLQIIR